eukprot:COSAG02_NODE_54977_length_293_cov_0.762887_1_plen_92_part_01
MACSRRRGQELLLLLLCCSADMQLNFLLQKGRSLASLAVSVVENSIAGAAATGARRLLGMPLSTPRPSLKAVGRRIVQKKLAPRDNHSLCHL